MPDTTKIRIAQQMARELEFEVDDAEATVASIEKAMAAHMNFMSSGTIGLPYLPAINRVGSRLGIRPPMWRHTRHLRRWFRFFGVNA